ncbi:MAG: L-rhamnose mutarotase [Flavobacteriaceae bacterium]
METEYKKYCFALDLKEDPEIIAAYREHHQKVWPEILESIRNTGIEKLEIYQVANRLFMVMETHFDFSLAAKAESDSKNPKVQQWETLMWNYQKALPFAKPHEKWVQMERIFKL